MRTRRSPAPLIVVLGALLTVVAPGPAQADAPQSVSTACGSPLSANEVDRVLELADTSTVPGSGLDRFEAAVERHREITDILVAHRDRRGLFSLGLNAVEHEAVLPLQRDPAALPDRRWSPAISYDLLARYLRNVHAEFSGTATDPAWANYFAMTRQCSLSPARVAMAGYNAHLTVDLAHAVATSGTTTDNVPDYYEIVDSIAVRGGSIVTLSKDLYGADLGPLWRFYFVGEGLDRLAGNSEPSKLLLRAADSGYNTITLANGFALQDPRTAQPADQEIDGLWRATDGALQTLSDIGGL
ncbi:DUF5995 family protein [Rhodococcus sp. TAF43]|uniref:DUF5995 family protein n=1 Tax=unclassified Rhodococcus (in: high G+C Gram-positive bacteria) TaxID=192944 RepID=UPI000E0AB959|nr:DUF5995 family protein [Rhodococcus sp. AG1013]RDI32641.1 hypothetical protein DEU38_103378 [Rhodococcus sp. AG1013]